MWWSIVVPLNGEPPEHAEIKLGTFNGDILGDRAAKKAAKAVGRDYIRSGGPGVPRLVESPAALDGCLDMTITAQ